MRVSVALKVAPPRRIAGLWPQKMVRFSPAPLPWLTFEVGPVVKLR